MLSKPMSSVDSPFRYIGLYAKYLKIEFSILLSSLFIFYCIS